MPRNTGLFTFKEHEHISSKSNVQIQSKDGSLWGNFRGGGTVLCPLCHQLPDGQEESFSCRKVKEIINIQGKYQQIFGWKFTKQIIETVQSI